MSPRVIALVCAVLMTAAVAGGDTLVLKDGRKLEGEVVEETDALVKFKIRGAVVSFKKDEVTSLTRGGNTDAAQSASEKSASPIPRAERSRASGSADVDEVRKRAAAARDRLHKLLARLGSGAGSASNIAREYEKLLDEVTKRRPKLDEAAQKSDAAVARYNEWVGRNNAEAASGRISDATKRGLSKAESEMKSARAAYDRLVALHNRDVDRLDTMKANFGTGQEKMEASEEELVKAFREADEAAVALCEAERRAGVVPGEADAAAGAAETGMTAEDAEVRWPAVGALTGDRKALAGRRVAFEARLGAFDAGKHTVQVYLGEEADPKAWSRELTVVLIGPGEAPPGEHAVLEGSVSSAAGNAIEVDRIITLK